MKLSKIWSLVVPVLALVIMCTCAQAAFLPATVATAASGTVFPGDVGKADPGTLVGALLTRPFISSLGTTAGTVFAAVYLNSTNTLDFYYQVTNNTTATNCGGAGQAACDPISRLTDTNFVGFLTATGFNRNAVGGFIAGTESPIGPMTADRNSVADVVGFSFNPPDAGKIQPGMTSFVLIVSTNATAFTVGNTSVIDGGVTTVSTYQPATAAPVPPGPGVPEPASFVLLGGGLIALAGIRRFRRA